jgi:hypothetical protein
VRHYGWKYWTGLALMLIVLFVGVPAMITFSGQSKPGMVLLVGIGILFFMLVAIVLNPPEKR